MQVPAQHETSAWILFVLLDPVFWTAVKPATAENRVYVYRVVYGNHPSNGYTADLLGI